MADWVRLQSDLLTLIAGRLGQYEDFVAFRGVCRSWKSAATNENFCASWSQIPWLMLAEKTKSDTFRGFHSLSQSKINYRMLPEASRKVCYSSQGWLVTVSQDDLEMNLLHPITRVQVPLPDPRILLADDPSCGEDLEFFYESFIQKALLSGSPNSTGGGNYIVSVIYGSQSMLAIWRSAGDFTWTKIVPLGSSFSDLINYQGKLFAIHYYRGNVHLWAVDLEDLDGQDPTLIVLENFCCDWVAEKLYLVQCCGKLLVVVRQGVHARELEEIKWEELDEDQIQSFDFDKLLESSTYGTTYLIVFKLNLDSCSMSIDESHWEEVHDLGRRALFLGHNSSFCIDIDASNESIKPNSIYFTDDAWVAYLCMPNSKGGGKDMGIYSLEDQTIVPHFQGESYSHLTPPIWIQPTL